MTKHQIAYAAKLYSLAMLAHHQGGGTPDQIAVIDAARKRAERKLLDLCVSPSEVTSLDACIALTTGGARDER